MERMTLKRFYALALLPVLLLCLYSPIPEVRAEYSQDFIDNLVNYTLTVTGCVKKGADSLGNTVYKVIDKTDQVYTGIANSIYDALHDNEITVDTGGNVTFSPSATSDIYALLGGSGLGGYNAVYLNNNSSNYYDPLSDTHNTSTTVGYFNSVASSYSDCLLMSYDGYLYDNRILKGLTSFDVSNVSFAVINGNKLEFYDSSYNPTSVDYNYASFLYYRDSPSTFYSRAPFSSTSSSTYYQMRYPYTATSYGLYYPNGGSLTLENIISNASIPFYDNQWGRSIGCSVSFSCPSGLVIGSSYLDALNGYNYLREPDYFITNTVNNFPSLTGDQITNTNFDNTYNTFVTNVNNIYNELDLPSFDVDIYKGIAQDQNKLLIDAIKDGVDNITSVIQTQGQKLDTIIGLLMHIRDMLQELPSGTGTSSGSAVSVDLSGIISRLDTLIANNVSSDDFDDSMSDLQDALDSISSSASSNNSQLIAINNKLIDLYVALIGNQNSPRDNPNNPESNNYYYGDNYWISEYAETEPPGDFMEDNITAFNGLTNSMKNVVPFCFVVMAVNLISAFSSDPVAPVFTIPFSLERFGYDEEVTIDFSEFNTLHVILTDGFSILFLIGMWFLFFRLLKFVLSFL